MSNGRFIPLVCNQEVKALPLFSRVLLSEIIALSSKSGYCFATNAYFANSYSVSTKTISKHISQLKKQGFIQAGTSPAAYGSGRMLRPAKNLIYPTQNSESANVQQKNASAHSTNASNPTTYEGTSHSRYSKV